MDDLEATRETRLSDDLPLPSVLGPFVDGVARIHATIHTKLLAGFLLIALMLLAMGVFSIAVISRMNDQVQEIASQQEQTDVARQMLYSVTAQSHFRAMALITEDDFWNDRVHLAKEGFSENLDLTAEMAGPARSGLFDEMRAIDERFAVAGRAVEESYAEGDTDRALELHIAREHEISHELEDLLNVFINDSHNRAEAQLTQFDSSRRTLTYAVATFVGVSLLGALFLGAVLSWSLIRPVRRIDQALVSISGGNFGERVQVPNRDEFGTLSANINRTSEQLSELYEELRALNKDLEQRVQEQISQLERASALKRYLPPQVADSILAGETQVSLTSTRRRLTTFFADIRGFTELAERSEPEELIDALNRYLTAMTEIVFTYEGTLDKYIGDAIMVFFGDPVPVEDHAERAVAMAFEMRARTDELARDWFLHADEELAIGIGISTGYVTVGSIGSPVRSDYTVVGNHVNLASRLSDQAEPGQILVSEPTLLQARSIAVGTQITNMTLKGVHRPIKIYEVNERTSSPVPG